MSCSSAGSPSTTHPDMNARDIPNKTLSRNEMVQWAIIIGSVALAAVTFVAFYNQIKLSRKQIEALEKQEEADHILKSRGRG